MSSWSSKRRLAYGGTLAVIVLAIIGYIVFSFFYKAPTCFDGIKNGNETGVDCGGSCQRLCPSAFLAPSVPWTSFEEQAPGFYNAAAYIVNPNNTGKAVSVPFHVVLYDSSGQEITDTPGFVSIPPHRNTLAFLNSISVGQKIPYRAFFEFTSSPNWQKSSDSLAALAIGDKRYTEDSSGSSLLVTLKNMAVAPLGKMSVYVVLSDINSNIIGFSKTIVDGISGLSYVQAPFTWPTNRHGKVISIEVLPVAE